MPSHWSSVCFRKPSASSTLETYWNSCSLLFLLVDIDSGYYTVKFDSLLLKEAVVEGDSVIPPLRREDGAESAASDEDSVDDSGYAKGEGGSGDGVSESNV